MMTNILLLEDSKIINRGLEAYLDSERCKKTFKDIKIQIVENKMNMDSMLRGFNYDAIWIDTAFIKNEDIIKEIRNLYSGVVIFFDIVKQSTSNLIKTIISKDNKVSIFEEEISNVKGFVEYTERLLN